MSETEFIDYYETLQVSSNADIDTIERVYRHLAKKFHPDNIISADNDRFQLILNAYKILSDPKKRAGYDAKYEEYWNHKWQIVSEASDGTAISEDLETRESLLSLMYIQRRRDIKNPGMGDLEMARLLFKPIELVDFHLWYLKAKHWVERTESGKLAITALGVDEVEKKQLRHTMNPLLPAPVSPLDAAEENGVTSITDG